MKPWFCVSICLSLLLSTAAHAQEASYSPPPGSEISASAVFSWIDAPQHSGYRLLFRRKDTGTIVASVDIGGNDTTICPTDTYCRLAGSAANYPTLETREYEWVVFAKDSATGIWKWWHPGIWSSFYVMPRIPIAVTGEWIGNKLLLNWPSSPDTTQYRADIDNVFTKTYTEDYLCNAPACAGESDVGHIDYGTIRVLLRACGLHGRCTQDGARTEAYRAPPSPVGAVNLVIPSENSTINGMTDVVWQDQKQLERWHIRIEKDTGGPTMSTVTDEAPWRKTVACIPPICSRQYPLTPGFYILTISAYSGGVWGPESAIAFTVAANSTTPEAISPADAQTTSIYPLFLWKKVAGADSYKISVSTDTEEVLDQTVACKTKLCTFDLLMQNLPLAPASYTWTVRVNVDGMPTTTKSAFNTSFSYVPPAPEIVQPLEGESIGFATQVSTAYLADPQVPFFTLKIDGPLGFQYTSPSIKRSSENCKIVQRDNVYKLNCVHTNPETVPLSCASSGPHKVVVKTHTFTSLSGGNVSLSQSPPRSFQRLCERIGGSAKDIYTIFAQNMQFLSVVDLTKVYGVTNKERVLDLVRYIRKNDFDVVALSEVFSPEARDLLSLHMRQGYPYQFGSIDTAGDVAFTLREGSPYEATSGLAIYSQFPAHKEAKSWNSNWQCTSELFNQISESHPLYESELLSLNDHLWFNQYCEAEGIDAQAAKGLAAIRLENPKTGVPLLVAWSHTQAATNEGLLTQLGNTVHLPIPDDYSYKDSYWKRETQLKEASESLKYLRGSMPATFDAFVLGDWNIPQPMSMSSAPKWPGGSSTNIIPGKPDLNLAANSANPFAMYDPGCALLGCADPKNPTYADLVGKEFDPTPDGWIPQTLYSQYWKAFDPRNTDRYLAQFYDLWLEQPQGNFGFTYDRRNPAALCSEQGEPCHGRNAQGFDHGQRYDVVLARLHASNIENMQRTGTSYPGTASARWVNKRSCVQHVHLARDFGKSDHYGTIIEVGPEEPYCSPMTAKAEAQNQMGGQPPNYVAPADKAFNKYIGLHEGTFLHGGANEWFYISEKGGYDFVNEGGLPFWVEAYDPKDLSSPLDVADSTQKRKGGLFGAPGCNQEASDASIEKFGTIPKECATEETRVTYKSPGPFYARIYPVNPDGSRCLTCTGNYRVRIRSRSCKIVWEAVPTVAGLGMADWDKNPEGWFGPGQRNCWFSVELRQPTRADDFQTFILGDLATANGNRCSHASGPGTCSASYTARLYRKGTQQSDPAEIPPGTLIPPITHDAGTNGSNLVTNPAWEIESAAKNPHHREQFLWLVERSDTSRAHVALLPWYTNLKSVLFRSIRALEIDDDDKFICIPIPLFGCIPIRDPFQTEDEARIATSVNNSSMGVISRDFERGSVFNFTNSWPGSSPNESSDVYAGEPSATTRGTTFNFTEAAWVHAEDVDDDSANDALIADHLMVGIATPGGGLDKQSSQIINKDIGNRLPDVPFLWEFTDTGFLGAKVDYELEGRILRDP
jgi:hypothetical protein